MSVKIRIRNGLKPNPSTDLGGASEGYVRGPSSDMIENTGGVVDLDGGHLLVHETGTPDMNVVVDPGVGYIPNADWDELDIDQVKSWEAVVNPAASLAIGANSSGSTRIDLICLKMDTGIVPDEYASNVGSLIVVVGTPGAGVPATPDNHYKLAEVEVIDGATEIANASITDSRVQIAFKEELLPPTLDKATSAEINTGTDDLKYITSLGLRGSILLNFPRGQLINGKIVPSVTSNNLTVAIKGMDGNDPSAANPVFIRIGDTLRTITAALSVTKNAGTNWFNSGGTELATKEVDYFVYLGYNATDGVVIGFARVPYGEEYDSFSATSTNQAYCAISTIANAAAGDDYELIGRFAATLSAGAGYTWTVPTFTNKNLIQRPVYASRTLQSAGTPSGFSVNPSTILARYIVDYDQVTFFYKSNSGTSNATSFGIAAPFTAKNESLNYRGAQAVVQSNGVWSFGRGYIYTNASSFTMQKNAADDAGFANSGDKAAEIEIKYSI